MRVLSIGSWLPILLSKPLRVEHYRLTSLELFDLVAARNELCNVGGIHGWAFPNLSS